MVCAPVSPVAGGVVCAGIVAPLFHVPYATLLQSESPREMVGRVVAAANALQDATMLFSPMLGAALAGRRNIS